MTAPSANGQQLPRVLVITVSYKTAALVEKALASVAAERERQAERLVIEALVVENASGEAAALRAIIDRNGWASWVELYDSPDNGGYAYGNNRGFEHAYRTGRPPDFFFLLNPDAEVRSDGIWELVRFLRDNPRVGIAGSLIEYESGASWRAAFRFPSVWSEIDNGLQLGLVTRLLKNRAVYRPMGDAPEQVDWLPGAAFMIRREVVDDIGGLDEAYFLYFEETEYCLRARKAGWPTWYVPQSRVMHSAGKSTGVRWGEARRMPDYWFESRRRYFTTTFGVPYAAATDAAALVSELVGRLKDRLTGRPRPRKPHFPTDLVRHGAFRPRNQRAAPSRSFAPPGRKP